MPSLLHRPRSFARSPDCLIAAGSVWAVADAFAIGTVVWAAGRSPRLRNLHADVLSVLLPGGDADPGSPPRTFRELLTEVGCRALGRYSCRCR